MTTSFKVKSQILYFFLSLPYLSSYTWFSQLYYHSDNCQPYSNTSSSSLASILLQEMNKCYQTSSTSSTLMTCSNTSTTITKNTYTYSDDFCGSSSTSASSSLISACTFGISTSCARNPGYESWAGVGIWQQSANGGLGGSCNACINSAFVRNLEKPLCLTNVDAGPQFIQAFPPYCTTDGQSSWKTTCTSTSLAYTQFDSVDCTGGVVGANSFTYSLGTCFEYTPPSTSGVSGALDSVLMGYASCSLNTIPGTSFLDIPPPTTLGAVDSSSLSGGAVAGIVVAIVVLVLICCLGGYYVMTNYDINEKLIKGTNHSESERDSSISQRTSEAAAAAAVLELSSLERGSEVRERLEAKHRKIFTDPTTFIIDVLTCACCYQEYD